MNEAQLTQLVVGVLGVGCACSNGAQCAGGAHNWRRAGRRNASRLFIRRTGQRPQGTIALNIPTVLVPEFLADPAAAGILPALNEDRSPAFRRYLLDPGNAHQNFLTKWVPLTIN